MTHLAKEETAAQVLAVMQARFERPSLADIEIFWTELSSGLVSPLLMSRTPMPSKNTYQLGSKSLAGLIPFEPDGV